MTHISFVDEVVLATVDLMSSLLSDLSWFFFLFPSLSHCGKIAKWGGNAAVMDNHRCMFRPEVFSIYCTVKPQFHNTKDDSLILTRGIILLKNRNHKQNHLDLKSKPWTRHYTVIFNTLYTWWCLNPSFTPIYTVKKKKVSDLQLQQSL